MITIDLDHCIGCLRCVSVCPFKVLDTVNGKPDPGEGKLCIKCLHCAAVCPQNAIRLGSLEGALPVEMPQFPEAYPKLIEAQLLTRRSYRHFQAKPVPEDILMDAVRIAAWAPSAKNQHPAKWIIINQDKKIKTMMDIILAYVRETRQYTEIDELYNHGKNVVMGNAGTLILAYARTDAVNPPVDTALALYSAELYLQAQGIGTCWAGYLTRMCNQIPMLRDILELPEGCQIYGALMAGYPDIEQYIHIPNRHKKPDIKWF
jgi:nitroreductase/NAD-dependent dihydropyrimidine dehydrogenase PreA subunit